MNDKQRAQVRLAALKLMDVSYSSGWLSEHFVGLSDPEEYKLKMNYFSRAVNDRKEAREALLDLVDEIASDKVTVRGENAHILEEALGKISEMEGSACTDPTLDCSIDNPLCSQMVARNVLRKWHS